MARTVMCKKLGKELPGLDFKPFNNELGERIFDNISKDAWKLWLAQFQEGHEQVPLGRRPREGEPSPLRPGREVPFRSGGAASPGLPAVRDQALTRGARGRRTLPWTL